MFLVNSKFSETFIVHKKVQEILPMHNKVSAQDKVTETLPQQETSPDQRYNSQTARLQGRPEKTQGTEQRSKKTFWLFSEGSAPHPACRRR